MNSDKIYPTMVIRSQAEAIELLEKENKQLKERINKAIEYIDNNSHYYNADGEIKFTIEEEKEETFCKDLLETLKGDSNE